MNFTLVSENMTKCCFRIEAYESHFLLLRQGRNRQDHLQCALLASYIKYRLGKRVMILDFDYPEFNLSHMRERDLLYLEREGIPFNEEDFYPIEMVRKKKRLTQELRPDTGNE